MIRHLLLVLAGLLVFSAAQPVSAQIIVTKNSSNDERIYMSETLRRAEHKIMIRAIGRVRDDSAEWALTFRSTDASDDVSISVEGNPVEPQRVSTDAEVPGGMTTLFFAGETFYDIANASFVSLTIGGKDLTLPDQVLDDMRRILNQSGGRS